jgi:hypothetical protein
MKSIRKIELSKAQIMFPFNPKIYHLEIKIKVSYKKGT